MLKECRVSGKGHVCSNLWTDILVDILSSTLHLESKEISKKEISKLHMKILFVCDTLSWDPLPNSGSTTRYYFIVISNISDA
jgi:hypothetical protein